MTTFLSGTTLFIGPTPDLLLVAEDLGKRGERIALMSSAAVQSSEYCRWLRQREIECEYFETDVTLPATVLRAFTALAKWSPRLDRLIFNAQISAPDLLESTSLDEIHRVMSEEFFGFVNAMQLAVPMFRRSGGGHALVIRQVPVLDPPSNELAVSASRASLQIYVSALRRELLSDQITVTEASLGITPRVSGFEYLPHTEIASGILQAIQNRPDRICIGRMP